MSRTSVLEILGRSMKTYWAGSHFDIRHEVRQRSSSNGLRNPETDHSIGKSLPAVTFSLKCTSRRAVRQSFFRREKTAVPAHIVLVDQIDLPFKHDNSCNGRGGAAVFLLNPRGRQPQECWWIFLVVADTTDDHPNDSFATGVQWFAHQTECVCQ